MSDDDEAMAAEERASQENGSKNARLVDSLPEDRQPDTVEQMDEEEGADAEVGPLSTGVLLLLLRRAIREEGVAKRSDLQSLETKVDKQIREAENKWQQKLAVSEAKVESLAQKVDTTISDLGVQMSKLESRLEAMASRPGSNSSTASPSSWAGRDPIARNKGSEGPSNLFEVPICPRLGTVRMPHKSENLSGGSVGA